jgi:hypothetical protein
MRVPFKTIIGAVAWLGAYLILATAGAMAGQNSLTVSWQASPSGNVAGYLIYYGTGSRAYTDAVWVGNTTSAILSGLDAGTTYYVAAVACDSFGMKSDFSNELNYSTTGVPASRPTGGGGSPPSGGGGSGPSGGGGPYSSVAGSYSGLISATNQDQVQAGSAGSFAVLVTSRGAYSGHLQIGSTRCAFSGSLDSQGQASNTLSRRTAPALKLQLNLGGNGGSTQVLGTLSDGDWVANLTGDRAQFNAKSNPAPYAGRYTLVFPGQPGTPSLPAGDGFGTAHVTSGGQLLFVGKLADGSTVSQSASISEAGAWPLYLPAYSGKGVLMGWLEFAATPNADLAGTVTWIKPSVTNSRYYPAGFTIELQATGSSYVPPARSSDSILNLTNGTVTFSGGDLADSLADSIKLGSGSRVTNLGSNWLNMNISPGTGIFSGRVQDGATGKFLPFGGVVFQKLDAGYGALFGADQSSQVLIGQ